MGIADHAPGRQGHRTVGADGAGRALVRAVLAHRDRELPRRAIEREQQLLQLPHVRRRCAHEQLVALPGQRAAGFKESAQMGQHVLGGAVPQLDGLDLLRVRRGQQRGERQSDEQATAPHVRTSARPRTRRPRPASHRRRRRRSR
jgi:hypothetical protein